MPSVESLIAPFRRKFDPQDTADRNRLVEAFRFLNDLAGGGTTGAKALHYARVSKAGNLNVPNNAVTAIPFDQTTSQNGGLHSDATSNTRFTIQRAGIYTISGHVSWPATNAGVRKIRIRLGGTVDIASTLDISPAAAAPDIDQTVSTGYFLNIGDYIEITLYQNSGGAINVAPIVSYSLEAFIGEH